MDNGVAFQLIKLHWGSHSDENSMRKVLVQQGRTLRELYLQSRSGTLFPLAACPHLDYLSGNYHTIEALLSGRHVTRLRWVPDLFDPFSHFGKLEDVKKELDQIRTLHLGGKLEALELVGLYDAECSFSPRSQPLQDIPLRTTCRREIVEELFRQCPKLLCVDMVQEDANVLFSELNYQRWERTSTQPRFVSVTEVRNGKFPWWNV
ncbi:hypothetical protein CPB84DRAFT_1752424 [Gymnopilus junonius]|uniref:Uncharacterized protein n=1 Tax=Gymnopilus junonius TaxID=109634 RepID=A0A9P5ND35_GYMJU|nr:hypothetical protein CPB84DRAFT_1752424 [Gymnopilus junonius]